MRVGYGRLLPAPAVTGEGQRHARAAGPDFQNAFVHVRYAEWVASLAGIWVVTPKRVGPLLQGTTRGRYPISTEDGIDSEAVATLTLRRPPSRNAMNAKMAARRSKKR